MPSPYPWHYTLRWPFYFRWPSTKNRTKMARGPVRQRLAAAVGPTSRLLFCGDIMVMQHDIIPVLHPDLAALMASADLFIGNCEAPIGTHGRNPDIHYQFRFHMPRECLQEIMRQSGLPARHWVLSTANNHSGDVGSRAYFESLELFSDMGVNTIGRWSADGPPVDIIQLGELRLGLVNWTDWLNCEVFGTDQGIWRRKDVSDVDFRRLKRDLELDLLIAQPHWEYEFQHFPHQETRHRARQLIDEQGIDVIVGAHPHTLQPMEIFEHGLCAYSLGNFCGLGNAWSVKLISLLELEVDSRGKICSYQLHFFVQSHEHDSVSIIPLAKVPASVRRRLENRIDQICVTQNPPEPHQDTGISHVAQL